MATINQLVSELAHSLKQPNSVPVKKALALQIIQVRNNLIRQSFEHHGYIDKGLQQKFKIPVDFLADRIDNKQLGLITKIKVPKPVRLTNNTPFHSVSIQLVDDQIMTIPYIKENITSFYKNLPGINNAISYDYINGYIHLNIYNNNSLFELKESYIIVEGVFEYPKLINTTINNELNIEGGIINNEININDIDYNDEFLLPEDMIPNLKKIILETFNPEIIRDTNEPNATTLIK